MFNKKTLIKKAIFFISFTCNLLQADIPDLPEIYQDVIVKGMVIKHGVRRCNDRYEAIKKVLKTLPNGFKSLDIGASQGYFSFKMAEHFQARCTMIEEGYTTSNYIWHTGDYLKNLCEQNSHLNNISLLQIKVYAEDLRKLRKLEKFDLVLAFSVIHHMKSNPNESHNSYLNIIDAILDLAPVVLIENPINTGDHTLFIQNALQKKGGVMIYESARESLRYEIYLFDRRNFYNTRSFLPNISPHTLDLFNGTYSN